MKKGEVALVIIAPEYAFGSSESQQELAVVPPNSTLYYEVELVSFVKVGILCSSSCVICLYLSSLPSLFCFNNLCPFPRTRNHGT